MKRNITGLTSQINLHPRVLKNYHNAKQSVMSVCGIKPIPLSCKVALFSSDFEGEGIQQTKE